MDAQREISEAACVLRRGMLAEAEERARRVVVACAGREPLAEAAARQLLGECAAVRFEERAAHDELARAFVLRRKVLGETHLLAAESRAGRGRMRWLGGDAAGARADVERSLRCLPETVREEDRAAAIAVLRNAAAVVVQDEGRAWQAVPLLERARDMAAQRGGGVDDLLVAAVLFDLGEACIEGHKPAEARLHLEAARAIRSAELGDRHVHTAITVGRLAAADLLEEHLADGRRRAREALRVLADAAGERSPHLVPVLMTCAEIELAQPDVDAALAPAQKAVSVAASAHGEDSSRTIAPRALLARVYERQRDRQRREESLRALLAAARKTAATQGTFVRAAVGGLSALLVEQRRYRELLALTEPWLKRCAEKPEVAAATAVAVWNAAAAALRGLGRRREAIKLLQRARREAFARFSADASEIEPLLAQLAVALEEDGRPEEAARYRVTSPRTMH